MVRCPWAKTGLYLQYHDAEWGVPMFVIGKRALTGLQDKETLEEVIIEGQARNVIAN
jgi:3-methyladenine DNA glycosylase Tag